MALLFITFSIVLNGQKPHPVNALEISLADSENVNSEIRGDMRIDKHSSFPITLYNISTPVYGETAVEKAKYYLHKNYNILGLSYSDLRDLDHYNTRSSHSGTVVRFRQHFNGLAVNNSEVTVCISPRDLVEMVGLTYQRNIEVLNNEVRITEEMAMQKAVGYIQPTSLIVPNQSQLMVYSNSEFSKLAYKVSIVTNNPLGEWHVYVDAFNGDIFKVEEVSAFYCNHNKKEKACHSHQCAQNHKSSMNVNGIGLVFDPDPLSSNQASYGGQFQDNDDLTNTSLDNSRFTKVLKDIELSGGQYTLKGPYAQITDAELPNKGMFTQAHSDFNFSRDDDGFEAVNCYYHIDSMMRYVNNTLGLNLSPYQYSGGVKFDPHGLNSMDQSHYLSGPGIISFGEGCVDDGEDSDVIHHELGHFLHDMVTSGGLSQMEGLSEGCGDYLAQSFNRSLGNWNPSDSAYNWVFNWDGHNICWDGRVTNNLDIYPTGLGNFLHNNGTLWSTTMMMIWDAIGRELSDKAFFEGLGMTNGGSNQNDAANAVFQAAINMNYSYSQLIDMYLIFTQRGYTIPPIPSPEPEFSESANELCIDLINTVSFFDNSQSDIPIVSRQWTFEGGSPSVSTDENPVVTYDSEGVFDVTLEVTNEAGSSQIIKTDYIVTLEGSNCPDCISDINENVIPISSSGAYNVYFSEINFPISGIISDVNVLNIKGIHTYLGDLDISLISPLGTEVILINDQCAGDEDFDIGFDDDVLTSVWPCPYNDNLIYQPTGYLSDFLGEDIQGNWRLKIVDDSNYDGGELQSWSLEICLESPPPNCDEIIVVTAPVDSTYHAWDIITANGIVQSQSTVVFKSENEIELQPGFEVKINAVFSGEIGDCPD